MPIYVQHEVLGRIPDVFNAEAIWQAPGLALFTRRPLLRDLLERCPREHKGRAATRCFSHVTLMLPQDDVDDDYHLTRGARARDLAQSLTALHQKDFGDLLGADQVRYDVVGADSLAAGEVEVKFGHAVYLPAADEKILYNVSVSRDSAIWNPVCPLYPNQRLALIGGEGSAAGVSAPGWPFGADGAILIINDGPDAPPTVQMRPKDGFDCRYDARSGYYTIKSNRGGIDASGAAPRLLLKISRVGGDSSGRAFCVPLASADAASGAPTAAAPVARQAGAAPAVWQRRTEATRRPDLTATPASADSAHAANSARSTSAGTVRPGESDATFTPVAQQRVSLVALALPRLSRYRDTGSIALELSFNRALAIAPDGDSALRISVNSADELYASTAAGRQRITLPASFAPLDQRTIALQPVAAGMADRYCAMLRLPHPIGAAVACGARFTFGRNAAMLAALRVLDSPRFLARSDASSGASADRIGLSRNAFSFEATPQGFQIGRLSATQALYHLDQQLDFVASIGDQASDAPYLLPAGHHLVAGHYILRFDA